MLEIENRICTDILTNKGKVKIFWDMDGTCASMEMHALERKSDPGFFYSKRPIRTMIDIMNKFAQMGAQTYILSFCSYNFQREDKIKWLHKYCGFILDENIIIIPRKESNIKFSESKQTLKAEYLKDYTIDSDVVYMIDDNESVLLGTKEILPYINIISPIDFIE